MFQQLCRNVKINFGLLNGKNSSHVLFFLFFFLLFLSILTHIFLLLFLLFCFSIFLSVLGYELAPVLYVKTLNFVQSRRDCEEYCLQEREFPCRSALYNDETTECRLSPEDRRTAPGHYYRSRSVKINYLENQCVRAHSTCPYVRTSDAYPTYTDVVETQSVDSSEACEKMCNANRHFLCRSYAYYSSNGQCFLSGDDSTSAHAGAQQKRSSIMYYERQCSRLTNNTAGEQPTASGITGTESPIEINSGSRGSNSGARGPVDSSRNVPMGTQDSSRPAFSGTSDQDSRIEDGSRRGSTSDVYTRPDGEDDRNRHDLYDRPKPNGAGSHDVHGRPEGSSGSRHHPSHSSSSNRDRNDMYGRPDQSGNGSRDPSGGNRSWNSGSSSSTDRQRTDSGVGGGGVGGGGSGSRISIGGFPFAGTGSSSGSSPTGSGVVGGSSVPGRDTAGGSVAKEIVFENGTIGGILTTRITRFPENLLPTVPPPTMDSGRQSSGSDSGRIRDSSSSLDSDSNRSGDASRTYHPPPVPSEYLIFVPEISI